MPARLFRPKGGSFPGFRPAATPLPLRTRAFCFKCTGRVLRMASRNFWPGSWHVLTVWFFSPHRPHLLGPLTGMDLDVYGIYLQKAWKDKYIYVYIDRRRIKTYLWNEMKWKGSMYLSCFFAWVLEACVSWVTRRKKDNMLLFQPVKTFFFNIKNRTFKQKVRHHTSV